MKEAKRGAKTESLSLRIDPKTKFILEFMVRATGIRITDLIERAIKDYAEKIVVGNGDFSSTKNWLHYWHPDDGVRTLNTIFDSDVRTSFEEDEIASFVEQHQDFFFVGGTNRQPILVFVQVLWPKIDEYLRHWREHKSSDRWATGTLMLQAIKAAGMKGPEWPKVAASARKPAMVGAKREDMDDEIPF
jgi:hypothetical protein